MMGAIHQELQSILTAYLDDNPGAERKLADEFQVAVSTVKRWQNGIASPHTKIAQKIIDFMKSK